MNRFSSSIMQSIKVHILKTRLSKLDILNETILFYGEDVSRRAMSGSGCVYNTEDGRHCAVGRCFSDEIKKQGIDFSHNVTNAKSLDYELGLDKLLVEKYRGQSSQFWLELQRLHDNKHNWGTKGLSDEGEKVVKEIKKTFGLK